MDEKYFEQASALEQRHRDHSQQAVQRQLLGDGQDDCEGCGDSIPHERRKAMPSAIRCIKCQTTFERTHK